jgi:hypothetical protein
MDFCHLSAALPSAGFLIKTPHVPSCQNNFGCRYRNFHPPKFSSSTTERLSITRVPPSWPDHLTGPLSWTGDQFESNAKEYTEELNADDTLELKAAVEAFQRL